jgi:hypothetical protein
MEIKYKIIRTKDYLLICSEDSLGIDNSKFFAYNPNHNSRNFDDWEVHFVHKIEEIEGVGTYFNDKHHIHCKNILAHLPLNNAPKLEGVDLLPGLPEENYYIEILAAETRESENQLALFCSGEVEENIFDTGYVLGYREATKTYTEQDMFNLVDILKKSAMNDKNLASMELKARDYIESLKQPKIPTYFVAEVETYKDFINGSSGGAGSITHTT